MTKLELEEKYDLVLYPKKNNMLVRAYKENAKEVVEHMFYQNRYSKKFEFKENSETRISRFPMKDWKSRVIRIHANA